VVRRESVRKWPRINDRVVIPFGGYGLVGTVIRVEGDRKDPYVTVEFLLDPEQEEPSLTTYRLSEIRPVETAA
jgi:rRNA processing protein Gar1